MNIESNQSLATTGIEGLDDVLGGGLPRNRLYLVQGDPGAGKTTLAMQFLIEGVKAGERVLYFNLSETKEELQSVAESHGWSLDGIDLYELSAMEELMQLDRDNSVFHPADVELSETTRALLDVVEQVSPTRAVFDSLSEMRLLAGDALRYRRQILSLKQYFTGRKCTVLLLDDRTSDVGDLQLQSICHGVIVMEQVPSSFGVDRRRLRVQKLRGVGFRSGYHDVAMLTGGLQLFPRLIAAEHRHAIDEGTLSTGISGLDAMLGGGVDVGVSALLLGPAGAGKSTVAIKCAVAAAERGDRAAIYSFEESPRTMFKRARTLGIDLERHVESGRIKLQHIDPAELTPGEFVQQVRDDVESGDIKVVVIDSLNGYINAMPEERFLILQLHELLSYLGHHGITSILVMAQHGFTWHDMASPVDLSYLADTVVLFRMYEFEGKLQQAVSVVKRRGGGHDRAIKSLEFNGEGGIDLGPALQGLRGVLTGVPVSAAAPGEQTV